MSEFLMKLSFALRRSPVRLLYSDGLLGRFAIAEEMPFFEREWGGPIWDVGASVGKYTTVLARSNPDSLVYAFEPNLNSLDYLGYRTSSYENVVVVPNALTLEGGVLRGTHDPDFTAPPTGPDVATVSIDEAARRFGPPAFVKMDIEGGEYELLRDPHPALRSATLLVSWHPELVSDTSCDLSPWAPTRVMDDITLLEPISGEEGSEQP